MNPLVFDPPLSRAEVKARGRKEHYWLYGYPFCMSRFMIEAQLRDPIRFPRGGTPELGAHVEQYQKSVIEKTGLHPYSWTHYCPPDDSDMMVLILGLGFNQTLHRPLKSGLVELAKEALGTTDEPQWFLYDKAYQRSKR